MVEGRVEVDAVFHALSNQTRREMLRRLRAGDLTVGQLAQPLPMSLAAASKHVAVLEQAGLLRRTVSGRTHVCRLVPGPLAEAAEWLQAYEAFWNERLDTFERVLREQAEQAARPAEASETSTKS